MPCHIADLILISEPFASQEREAGQIRTVAPFWSLKVHMLKFVAIPCSIQAGLFSYVVLIDYGVKNSYATLEELQLTDN